MPRMILPAALALGLLLPLAPASAAPPPPNALPLSEIVRMLEQRGDVAYFDEIEWDDDGYWEVEYIDRQGVKRKLKVNPVTGEARPDR
ncbi:PepSY domain-containing protein [Crenalkalicoccus roseus]|uniref:PepSY domain-containing protein n=1 Tax=Crenalkalicoccus roseus TaxID=1485588 RepID=UPI001F00D90C|nr:PepSY domain-containing protein [Crenalkalicoccus roseus]